MGRVLRTSILLRALSFAALLTAPAALLITASTLLAPLAHGQDAPAAPPQTALDVLHQMSAKADVIFAGEVMAIRRPNDGVVEIEFRVDRAIRGCAVGTPYILREWAGLWTADNQRYHVGRRLLMLLHAPSDSGMNSPVGGLDGAIPIRQGDVVTPLADMATPQQPPYVDLRWLGARLPHAVTYRSDPPRIAKRDDVAMPILSSLSATMMPPGAVPSFASIASEPGNASSSEASVPAQQASVNAVMGMLISWQKAQNLAQ
jgi:hypothetical protein